MIQKRQRRRRDGSTYTVYRVRWYDSERERSKTFDKLADARAFEGKVRTLKRGGALAELDAGKETLADFVAEWWELHATPNLERATLKTYATLWNRHALPRIGDIPLRELSPRIFTQLRTDLESDAVGSEAIRKTMAMIQGILQRAVEWERIRSNPLRVVRKPATTRQRAVEPLSPARIEAIRAHLVARGRRRDATIVAVLAYAGLRPQEALALEWRHIRDSTLLVEQAISDGRVKAQKNRRPPRTVELLAPLRQDLNEWHISQGRPAPESPVFPTAEGQPWREHDYRNWRKRIYSPAAEAAGVKSPRPYDLRHSFASLLIHENKHSIVEIAAQLGHNPNVCLSTYGHVIAELKGSPVGDAAESIREARRPPSKGMTRSSGFVHDETSPASITLAGRQQLAADPKNPHEPNKLTKP